MKQQHTIIIKYVIILTLETDLQTAKLGVTMMIMNKYSTCHGFAIRDLFKMFCRCIQLRQFFSYFYYLEGVICTVS